MRLSKCLRTPPSPCLSRLASARPPGGRQSWRRRAVTYGKELKFESTHCCPQSSYSRHVMLDEPCCSPAPRLCPAPTRPPEIPRSPWDGAICIPSFSTQISAVPSANFPATTFILCPPVGKSSQSWECRGFRRGRGRQRLADRFGAWNGCPERLLWPLCAVTRCCPAFEHPAVAPESSHLLR